MPISFRFTFYVFFFLLRSDKTCNFHHLPPVMYERGYKFSSVGEKQVVGRADITTEKQTASPVPFTLVLEMVICRLRPKSQDRGTASLENHSAAPRFPTHHHKTSLTQCLSRSIKCKEKKEAGIIRVYIWRLLFMCWVLQNFWHKAIIVYSLIWSTNIYWHTRAKHPLCPPAKLTFPHWTSL